MTVRIAYPDAVSYQVSLGMDGGKRIEMNNWDDELQAYGPITQTSCGENRYIAI